MNAILKSPVGDYDLRGRDIDTCMVGEVRHIDRR